jgi:hypothetical protein
MKIASLSLVLLQANAQIGNTDTNDTGQERSVWVETDPKYVDGPESIRKCTKTEECVDPDSVCAMHYWEYN